MLRTCTSCKIEKDLEYFYLRSNSTYRYRSQCIECVSTTINARRKVLYEEDPEAYIQAKREKGRRTFRRAGSLLTSDQYHQLVHEQRDKCKICNRIDSRVRNGRVYNLVIDHDHATGEFRGVICSNCNIALGLFRDNTEVMQVAIDYLKQSRDDTMLKTYLEEGHVYTEVKLLERWVILDM